MKVDIKRTEEMKGMMSKKKVYVVTVQVKLSEEERKVIELTDALGDCIAIRTPIGKQPDENNQEPLRVSFISGGHPNSYDFANLRQANDYMDELVNGLEALKNFIVHHAGHSAEISREL